MMSLDEVERRNKINEGRRFFSVDQDWDLKKDKLKTNSHVLPEK
jgi:hypothetical protein